MSINLNWPRRDRRGRPAASRTRRPALEALEDRWMPSVTPHGGAVISSVEINAIYYGSTWQSDPNTLSASYKLSGFQSYLVDSPYMDMLSKAGYGTGEGALTGITYVDRSAAEQGNVVNDSELRTYLQNSINAGSVNAPGPEQLYVFYVEPNVKVVNDDFYDTNKQGYDDSVSDFAGYHSNFTGTDANGNSVSIRYAVIPTPGGTINNGYTAGETYLSTMNEMTQAASHEIAESVTDPDVSTGSFGWYDDTFTNPNGTKGAEIGDIYNGQTVYLNGYAVQGVSDQSDLEIIPAAVSFPNSHFAATSGKVFTTTLATGSDPTGLTNVNNLGAYILWGDGSANYGTVALDAQGNFDVTGSHTYNTGGSYQAEIYVFDSSNSSNYSISYDTVTVISLTRIPTTGRKLFATGLNTSLLQQAGTQQALALDPAVTQTTAAPALSPSSLATTPAFTTVPSTGLSVGAATGGVADAFASEQNNTPALTAGTTAAAMQPADAAFFSLNLDPLAMALGA